MKKRILILILATTGLFSCKQNDKSTPDSAKDSESQKSLTNKSVYSTYKYTDSDGAHVTIQNSFPKGGMKYTDPTGKEYRYAIFWTQISNETNHPLEVRIDFPIHSYEVPSMPGSYFKILMPPNPMTSEKVSLFNYGLTDLEPFLDQNFDKSSSLKRIINPKKSSSFYVVLLSVTNGARGTLRTGLSIKGQNLFYKINDKEIHCGNINLENLILQQ